MCPSGVSKASLKRFSGFLKEVSLVSPSCFSSQLLFFKKLLFRVSLVSVSGLLDMPFMFVTGVEEMSLRCGSGVSQLSFK